VDWLGCRQNVLSDLCCDLFAPGLNIWMSPQAPSSSLQLYDGLSIVPWSPITLQGLVRTAGLSLMTYSQRNISGHVDTLSQDLQSQACLIWQLLYIHYAVLTISALPLWNCLLSKQLCHINHEQIHPVYTWHGAIIISGTVYTATNV